MKKSVPKLLIGRKELVDFPTLKLFGIEAKIDTGAYTSAINCQNIKITERDGVDYVSFNLLDPSHPKYNGKRFRMPLYAKKRIKNSFGKSEERCIVKTVIKLFGERYDIELSLSDRSKMDYPVLLGRKLLQGKFIVDVSKGNLSYKQKRRNK